MAALVCFATKREPELKACSFCFESVVSTRRFAPTVSGESTKLAEFERWVGEVLEAKIVLRGFREVQRSLANSGFEHHQPLKTQQSKDFAAREQRESTRRAKS